MKPNFSLVHRRKSPVQEELNAIENNMPLLKQTSGEMAKERFSKLPCLLAMYPLCEKEAIVLLWE